MYKTKLVFLNCCKTADGLLYAVGLAGLTNAFIKAGVREVVAYRGLLSDKFASHFVDVFYEEYSQLFEADTALKAAQLKMIEDVENGKFWSSAFDADTATKEAQLRMIEECWSRYTEIRQGMMIMKTGN